MAEKSNLTLEAVSELANRQLSLEAELVAAEQVVKDIQVKLSQVSEVDLPDVMERLGIEEFKMSDGSKLELKEQVSASLSKEREPEGIKWFEEHGLSGLVKRSITIQFGKGEDAWAKKFVADLRKRKKPVKADDRRMVHAQTLLAQVREMLREGIEFPLELFGVYRSRISKITLPKGD